MVGRIQPKVAGEVTPERIQQPGTSSVELLREDRKPLCDFNRRLAGKLKNPPEMVPLPQMQEDQIKQGEHVQHSDDAQRDPKWKGPT